jgi:hypothetical protein
MGADFKLPESFLGEEAPTAHFMVPPAMAVAPSPNELILIKFLLVCILLIFRVLWKKITQIFDLLLNLP